MKTIRLLATTVSLFTFVYADAQKAATSAQEFQRDFATLQPLNNNKDLFLQKSTASSFYNDEKYRRFKKMRTGGIVLTGVGAGLITTGILLIAIPDSDGDRYNEYGDYNIEENDQRIIGGVLCLATGILATGGGITMWVIGNKKMKKYGGGQMSVQPTKNGLGLAYRF